MFGDEAAAGASEVLNLWDKVKLQEKQAADQAGEESGDEPPAGLLDGVPVSFPALMQAQKISRKALRPDSNGKRSKTFGARFKAKSMS